MNVTYSFITSLLAFVVAIPSAIACFAQTMGIALLLSMLNPDPSTSGSYFAMGFMVSCLVTAPAGGVAAAIVVICERELSHIGRSHQELNRGVELPLN